VLSEADLVERAPDPEDGRSALVSITATGRDRLRRLRGRKNAYLARRMRDLPADELAALDRAAEILEGILEDERPTKRMGVR
jgi:DNA-binding MarR family transcriptional regulator